MPETCAVPGLRATEEDEEAILSIDGAQCVVAVNDAALRLFGCSRQDALGSSLARFIPQRLHAVHEQHVRTFMASGARGLHWPGHRVVTGLHADGRELTLDAAVTRIAVLDALGPRDWLTVVLRDLSRPSDPAVALALVRQQMFAVFDMVPAAIWITEHERVTFANRACLALFGATDAQQVVGRPVFELMEAPSHPVMRQALSAGVPAGATLAERIVGVDGRVRDVEIVVMALPDHGHTALQMVLTDITEREREKQHLARSRSELRHLSANLVNAREAERRRIARELHDELGQRLTALRMALCEPGDAAPADGRLSRQSMLGMVDDTIAAVRRLASDLRPPMLDDLGLNTAIEWLAGEWMRRLRIDIALDLDDVDPPVGEEALIGVYRMVQEALTNVARHARATQVRVSLHTEGDQLLLTVQDDGVGADPQAVLTTDSGTPRQRARFGLLGLRERVHMLGGGMVVGPVGNGGWRLQVRLPLEPGPLPTDSHFDPMQPTDCDPSDGTKLP